MQIDFEHAYRAVSSRDRRFDGWIYVAVTTTGIYCRPSCPAVTPKRANVRFYPTAAAAQVAGFRACKRCRPDVVPGSPEWDHRADLTARAMRLIADGAVDRDGVAGVADRLGYSPRHLHRQLCAEVGAGPLALARAQRAHTARLLLETTAVPCSLLAFAAGFASIRQFNDTVRTVFAATPTQLRRAAGSRRTPHGPSSPGAIALRLPYRTPFDLGALMNFFAARAVDGVEEVRGLTYRRTLRLPHGGAIIELAPSHGAAVACRLWLDDLRDLAAAVQRCRRLADLDADPVAVAGALGADPQLCALVRRAPGRRVARSADPHELVIRAILGQQVSVAAARALAGELTRRFGQPLAVADGGLTRRFPESAALAEADPARLPLPRRRAEALVRVAGALASGALVLDEGVDRAAAVAALRALPGVGEWTADYCALRALGDPDAFPAADLGLRRAATALGLPSEPAALRRHSHRWGPWRAYAAEHLWALNAALAHTAADASGVPPGLAEHWGNGLKIEPETEPEKEMV